MFTICCYIMGLIESPIKKMDEDMFELFKDIMSLTEKEISNPSKGFLDRNVSR